MQRREKEKERLKGVYKKRKDAMKTYAAIREFMTKRAPTLLSEFDEWYDVKQNHTDQNKEIHITLVEDTPKTSPAQSDTQQESTTLNSVALNITPINEDYANLEDPEAINHILSTIPLTPLPILTPEVLNDIPELNQTLFENELTLY